MIFGKKNSQLSDEELIRKFRESSRKRWVGELFNRYAHLVYGVCMKYLRDDAESKDATLALFEKLLHDLKNHDIDNFSSWLYSVSRNHCLMILRKRQTLDKHIRGFGEENREGDLVEDKVLNEVKLEKLETSLDELKEDQQRCVRLFYLEQKSYQEVSDITGLTLKEVKSHIQNGKRNLKIKLLQHDEFRA